MLSSFLLADHLLRLVGPSLRAGFHLWVGHLVFARSSGMLFFFLWWLILVQLVKTGMLGGGLLS